MSKAFNYFFASTLTEAARPIEFALISFGFQMCYDLDNNLTDVLIEKSQVFEISINGLNWMSVLKSSFLIILLGTCKSIITENFAFPENKQKRPYSFKAKFPWYISNILGYVFGWLVFSFILHYAAMSVKPPDINMLGFYSRGYDWLFVAAIGLMGFILGLFQSGGLISRFRVKPLTWALICSFSWLASGSLFAYFMTSSRGGNYRDLHMLLAIAKYILVSLPAMIEFYSFKKCFHPKDPSSYPANAVEQK